jgi:hypothetical protein
MISMYKYFCFRSIGLYIVFDINFVENDFKIFYEKFIFKVFSYEFKEFSMV